MNTEAVQSAIGLEDEGPKGKMPFVSIIMPVHNEEKFIKRSLRALLEQTYPRDKIEIVIADGMSTDSTREIIGFVASTTDIPIKIVDNPKQIAPSGLNCAIEAAEGEIIVRVDGHCEIEPEYLANCVGLLREGRAEGVGGPIETIGETLKARAIAIAMSSTFGVGGSAFRTINDREMYTDTVAFPGYTRKIIERVGMFNEELVRNQDDEYNYRIRKFGGRILLSPTIRSRYYSRSTLMSLWRQYFQYGYWKVRVLQMHPRQMSIRQFVPFLFVFAVICLTGLSMISTYGQWGLAALIGSYIVVNIAASVLAAWRGAWLIPLVSLSFSILHVSYGLGFALGLVSFWKNWNRPALDVSLSKT